MSPSSNPDGEITMTNANVPTASNASTTAANTSSNNANQGRTGSVSGGGDLEITKSKNDSKIFISEREVTTRSERKTGDSSQPNSPTTNTHNTHNSNTSPRNTRMGHSKHRSTGSLSVTANPTPNSSRMTNTSKISASSKTAPTSSKMSTTSKHTPSRTSTKPTHGRSTDSDGDDTTDLEGGKRSFDEKYRMARRFPSWWCTKMGLFVALLCVGAVVGAIVGGVVGGRKAASSGNPETLTGRFARRTSTVTLTSQSVGERGTTTVTVTTTTEHLETLIETLTTVSGSEPRTSPGVDSTQTQVSTSTEGAVVPRTLKDGWDAAPTSTHVLLEVPLSVVTPPPTLD